MHQVNASKILVKYYLNLASGFGEEDFQSFLYTGWYSTEHQ